MDASTPDPQRVVSGPTIAGEGLKCLAELALILRTRFAATAAPFGIGSMQAFRILEILAEWPEPVGPSALAERLYLTRSAATQILHSLQAKSLIERTDHPDDRRQSGARLTERGADTVTTFIPLMRAREEQVMAALTLDEQQVFVAMLRRLIGHVISLDSTSSPLDATNA